MKDSLKYICSIIKEGIEKICKDWVDYMLYSEPPNYNNIGVPYSGGGERIRVIGSIVTRY